MKYLTQVEPGQKVHLDKIDPSDTGKVEKKQGKAHLHDLGAELRELQELLYAANTHSVLIVLQSLDTGGKDGVISHVMSHVGVLGCHVVNFGVPSAREAAHDFLWRVHRATPMQGELSIFNRSHYEDVLVARVHELVAPKIWEARYEHINNFEKLLTDNRTIVLKFYLHISKEEQEKRLLAREQDSTKAWKLNVGDWQERSQWEDYRRAYEDALA